MILMSKIQANCRVLFYVTLPKSFRALIHISCIMSRSYKLGYQIPNNKPAYGKRTIENALASFFHRHAKTIMMYMLNKVEPH